MNLVDTLSKIGARIQLSDDETLRLETSAMITAYIRRFGVDEFTRLIENAGIGLSLSTMALQKLKEQAGE